MDVINILMGPKLGDLFHSLTVPAYLWQNFQVKTNFYLIEKHDTFFTSLERTYSDLLPVLSSQVYINDFQIYDQNKHEIHIDLNLFRYNGLLYTRSFWAIFLHTAIQNNPIIPRNFTALDIKPDKEFENCLLIYRKPDFMSDNPNMQKMWKRVIEKFDKVFFLDMAKTNYDKFFYKDKCELIECSDLLKSLELMKGCKAVMANICSTLAMATTINCPRIGELQGIHIPHYADDYLFFDNVEFFDENKILSPPDPFYLK